MEEKEMKTYGLNGIPPEAQILYRRGLEMSKRQKDEIASRYFKQAIFIAPLFSRAYHELVNCLKKIGRTDEAEVYYQKAVRIGLPNTCDAAAGLSQQKRIKR
jgi:tetratricopeptide (TPR) repeat protein